MQPPPGRRREPRRRRRPCMDDGSSCVRLLERLSLGFHRRLGGTDASCTEMRAAGLAGAVSGAASEDGSFRCTTFVSFYLQHAATSSSPPNVEHRQSKRHSNLCPLPLPHGRNVANTAAPKVGKRLRLRPVGYRGRGASPWDGTAILPFPLLLFCRNCRFCSICGIFFQCGSCRADGIYPQRFGRIQTFPSRDGPYRSKP